MSQLLSGQVRRRIITRENNFQLQYHEAGLVMRHLTSVNFCLRQEFKEKHS